MQQDDFNWQTGSSGANEQSDVSRRRPLPMSESLKAFRATLPDLQRMTPGQEHFIPCLDPREEYVIATSLRRLNARHSGKHWFGLQEWRSHVRGRLVVCVSPADEPEWREVWRLMTRSMQINKRGPPLDRLGNALIPRPR
jgi:hypothetical protein